MTFDQLKLQAGVQGVATVTVVIDLEESPASAAPFVEVYNGVSAAAAGQVDEDVGVLLELESPNVVREAVRQSVRGGLVESQLAPIDSARVGCPKGGDLNLGVLGV
ncbi:MAG: hypothetical protein KC561_05590 [Myxococcales bacterium]|nr:hypothetical protein [Myxococcales bacterium]